MAPHSTYGAKQHRHKVPPRHGWRHFREKPPLLTAISRLWRHNFEIWRLSTAMAGLPISAPKWRHSGERMAPLGAIMANSKFAIRQNMARRGGTATWRCALVCEIMNASPCGAIMAPFWRHVANGAIMAPFQRHSPFAILAPFWRHLPLGSQPEQEMLVCDWLITSHVAKMANGAEMAPKWRRNGAKMANGEWR